MIEKTLDIDQIKTAKANISDLKVFGDGDTFKLICKASSQEQGWMKSTKAMEIDGVGCVVQVTTQQKNPDGSYSIAEALTFVPGVFIHDDQEDVGRRILVRDSQNDHKKLTRVFVVNNPAEQ